MARRIGRSLGARSPIFAQSAPTSRADYRRRCNDARAVVISLVSLTLALIALFVNVGGLVRRPKITGNWGPLDDSARNDQRRQEGLWITVTARRRPIEVSEVGVMFLPKKTPRRQLDEWQVRNENYRRVPLDQREALLSDGETMQTGVDLDRAIEMVGEHSGREYCYVIGSGKVYFVRPNSKLRRWLSAQKAR
jgi:hypothetical protein